MWISTDSSADVRNDGIDAEIGCADFVVVRVTGSYAESGILLGLKGQIPVASNDDLILEGVKALQCAFA